MPRHQVAQKLKNNNWTPCCLEDFACTLTTTVANRSVALGPLLFSLVLNGSTCLLHILAQMAVMLVWKGCFFLSLSGVSSMSSVCVQMLVVPVVSVAWLPLKVFSFSSHLNFSAASHSQRKDNAHTECPVQ